MIGVYSLECVSIIGRALVLMILLIMKTDQNRLPAHWGNTQWDTSYLSLPPSLYRIQVPTPVAHPKSVVFNAGLAQSLGLSLEAFQSETGAQVLAGNALIEGSEPLAQAYAGHQFGHFTQLGDGRAILLGEHLTPSGVRVDIQLKGSGRTPFSRNGDGRAALGPMLREFVVSEALHALGIPTTRSLAVTVTGEPVFRDRVLPGAILCRIAASHLRVGTFEYAATLRDRRTLQTLIHYALNRHYPQEFARLKPSVEEIGFEHALVLSRAVVQAQARLIAQWLSVGFIHGVMNTDNMTISGESIDFGPCAFMDEFNLQQVFSSIDRRGRYAYIEQPKIALWNLTRFVESLLEIFQDDSDLKLKEAEAILNSFHEIFNQNWIQLMGNKIGLSKPAQDDLELIQELLGVMHSNRLDFHSTWLTLTDIVPKLMNNQSLEGVLPQLQEWMDRWKLRLEKEAQSPDEIHSRMRRTNPIAYPRNHQVEAALAAAEGGDFDLFHRLVAAVQDPFTDQAEQRRVAAPPETDQPSYQTFCGT